MDHPDLLPNDAQWRRLSVSSHKRELFEQDVYFREAWADCEDLFEIDVAEALTPVTLLCAKPDAVVGRRLRPMLDYAVEHGFAPIGVAESRLGRHSMRDIWRYDWHVYTADRLRFSTIWYTSAPMLVFALEDLCPEPGIPASVRLTSLKGHALASRRGPDEMRSRLAPPNTVLNFVHVTDEPADVVREAGILFESDERIALLRSLGERRGGAQAHAEAVAAIEDLYARHSAHDLDAVASLRRLRAAGMVDEAGFDRIARCLDLGGSMSWNALISTLSAEVIAERRWDFISLASAVIPRERPLESPLRNPDIHDWRRAG
ncbi:MAG: hypothetical protein E6Q88_02915 [Lysobacteraceae bacterium]|nr:MAG: hypothetical protein E6Q88_02915 [Xanthomonadaceae bacterium]